MTMTTSAASATTTISAPVTRTSFLLRAQREHQPVYALDPGARAARERLRAGVARAPRRSAQLGLADRAGRQVLERDRHLADQRVDHRRFALARCDAAEQWRAQHEQRDDRE